MSQPGFPAPSDKSLQGPPEWALEPAAGWVYLLIVVVAAVAGVFPLSWLLAIVAAVFTYMDRQANGFPVFWWTVAVLVFGPLAYLFFVYKRPRPAIVFGPQAAISQQARMVRGLSPQSTPSAAAPADWYPDPTGETRLRYWDGDKWTDHTAA